MLTTSEHNYKRSLFSFQQSCINQSVTQSIGIHLKRKIIVIKKRASPKTNFYSAQVRKTPLIVHSGFKTIKKQSLWLHVLQREEIVGRCSPCISPFPPFTAGVEMVHEQQTGATSRTSSSCHWLKWYLWHRKVVAGAGGGKKKKEKRKKADTFINGSQSLVQF